jgi:TonB family protein
MAIAAPPLPPPAATGLISGADYPKEALDRGYEGPVRFGALVGPDGRVDNCKIVISSGYEILDKATCALVTARARFAPGTSSDGKPMYSVFKNTINWRMGSPGPSPNDQELEVTINRAPEGVKLPANVRVSYVSKLDGSTTNCQAYHGQDQSPTPPPQVLVELACRALAQQPPEVIRTSTGQAVEASNTMTVGFSVKR